MMDDKKRKKFGLSLKNTKKQAVTKTDVKEQCSAEASSSRNWKEQSKSVVGWSSCLEECGLKNQRKSTVNTLEKESLVNNEEERERILWKNLFSGNSSANWETMEDLPIANVSHTNQKKDYKASNSKRMETTGSMKTENGNNAISSSLALDFKANQETDTLDIYLYYEDLPKPCIACYARKPCLLTWSQDGDDKRMEESDTYNDISPYQKDSALDTNTTSIKRGLQNNFSLFQRNADALKMNAKPADKLFNQNMKRKDSVLQLNRYISKNHTIKTNVGCLSRPSEGKNCADTTIINLTSHDSQEKPDNRLRIGRSLDFTSTKEQTFYKQKNYVFHTKKSTVLTNADLKDKSEKLNLAVGDSGAKRNDAVVKKEILKCCPICQFQFPQGMNKQGIDQHISCCIGNEELFIDDDKEDW